MKSDYNPPFPVIWQTPQSVIFRVDEELLIGYEFGYPHDEIEVIMRHSCGAYWAKTVLIGTPEFDALTTSHTMLSYEGVRSAVVGDVALLTPIVERVVMGRFTDPGQSHPDETQPLPDIDDFRLANALRSDMRHAAKSVRAALETIKTFSPLRPQLTLFAVDHLVDALSALDAIDLIPDGLK